MAPALALGTLSTFHAPPRRTARLPAERSRSRHPYRPPPQVPREEYSTADKHHLVRSSVGTPPRSPQLRRPGRTFGCAARHCTVVGLVRCVNRYSTLVVTGSSAKTACKHMRGCADTKCSQHPYTALQASRARRTMPFSTPVLDGPPPPPARRRQDGSRACGPLTRADATEHKDHKGMGAGGPVNTGGGVVAFYQVLPSAPVNSKSASDISGKLTL